MKALYTTMHPSPDNDALRDASILFNSHQTDLLPKPMVEDNAHMKGPVPDTVPISRFNTGLSGQYVHSNDSSYYGDSNDMSESENSLMNGREDGMTFTPTGIADFHGNEQRHTPSPFLNPQPQGKHHTLPIITPSGTRSVMETQIIHDGIASAALNGHEINHSNSIINKPQRLGQPTESSSPSPQEPNLSTTPELFQLQVWLAMARSVSASSNQNKDVEFKARSSIPSFLLPEEFARQSILAAESSRLNPFALHPGEYKLLREHITPTQVTIYLNIRNAILRLWTRNPLVGVSLEEAVGCAREPRYFMMAGIAYSWLLRNGYINFGCIQVPSPTFSTPRTKPKGGPQLTVLVIGAGMSGLGCARQLEGLFAQAGKKWADEGRRQPKVTVLEARRRIGGRVYSHTLHNQAGSSIAAGLRCTAEMGAQIVTGFERGNPLNLYNDILERASVYRTKPATFRTIEGDRHLMFFGLDPSDTGGPSISTIEDSKTPFLVYRNGAPSKTEEKPSSGVEKLAGRAYQLTAGFNQDISSAEAAKTMGWDLKPGTSTKKSLDLDTVAHGSENPTLGETMDNGIKQYQDIANLTDKDLRLLNWHHANLEYANAANVNQLSLSGWDQDIGNEWDGEHTEIIGGYQQVPRGLWQCPSPLDVHFGSVIKRICYDLTESGLSKAVRVECRNGDVYEADKLVLTTPLGVLKDKTIEFDPPLPDWKQGAIERMGFGLLNKVVLVYEKPFWETDRDMFGLLNEAERKASLDQMDYSTRRGRFYLFWNCIKTSGRPVLVALMAGTAAYDTEESTDESLIAEVTDRLVKMFAPASVPLPSETVVTRWKKDPFARGSYSYVGPRTQTGDYDVMAKPHGPLHFAGEATCGTHPATVHGAYLSGLRAAAEVTESLLGPIQVPTPLVEKKIKAERASPPMSAEPKRKVDSAQDNQRAARERNHDYDSCITAVIVSQIGDRPVKPSRPNVNPYLLYTKDYWHICKAECDEARRAATGDPTAKASKTEIRTALGAKWRNECEEIKRPYLDQAQQAKEHVAALLAEYPQTLAEWEKNARRIREEYVKEHPPPSGAEGLSNNGTTPQHGGKRLRRL
ncbi:hypothetical protein GQ43DRAFT_419837 [Delitschia confertaspora ATCC 74209]|uniref:SWIRM domain-containing protein n=1 Tax=Delitschia confertaspora ATCC 74209 TaxID=1513339 RepID=A0A9P4JIB4_9PLEO|nr:hypothetical protein GQ43DRAFT_419837 [Delitschia confertaspora ATCC 74209]